MVEYIKADLRPVEKEKEIKEVELDEQEDAEEEEVVAGCAPRESI